MDTIVLSLGGSLVAPNGMDTEYVKQFVALVKQSKQRFIIVVGGEKSARAYQEAGRSLGVSNVEELDWIGIMVTRLNAELIRAAFGRLAHNTVIIDPNKKVSTKKRVIVAAGWKPGRSTDYDTVLLAKQFKANKIINLTNTDYIYDKDPMKYADAQCFKQLSWKQYKGMVGTTWIPSMNTPFDPVATKLAEKSRLVVHIVNGSIDNLKQLLSNKIFVGTTLH